MQSSNKLCDGPNTSIQRAGMASRPTPLAIVTATNGNALHEKLSEGREPSKRAVGLTGQPWKKRNSGMKKLHRKAQQSMWGGAAVGPAMGSTAAEIKMGDGEAC